MPLIALHGALCNSLWWAPLEQTVEHARILLVDLPGHGLSEQGSGVTDLYAMASAITSLMHTLGIFDRDYGFMVHSLGGTVGLLASRLAPRKPVVFVSLEGNVLP